MLARKQRAKTNRLYPLIIICRIPRRPKEFTPSSSSSSSHCVPKCIDSAALAPSLFSPCGGKKEEEGKSPPSLVLHCRKRTYESPSPGKKSLSLSPASDNGFGFGPRQTPKLHELLFVRAAYVQRLRLSTGVFDSLYFQTSCFWSQRGLALFGERAEEELQSTR